MSLHPTARVPRDEPAFSPATAIMGSPADAARRYGLGRSTIYKLIGQGVIPVIKTGSRTLIPYAEADHSLLSLATRRGR